MLVMRLCLLGISCDFVGCRSQTPLFLQEEQNTAPLSMLLNVVDTERSFGNRCFNHSRFEDAKDRYKQVASEKRVSHALNVMSSNEPLHFSFGIIL